MCHFHSPDTTSAVHNVLLGFSVKEQQPGLALTIAKTICARVKPLLADFHVWFMHSFACAI